MSFRVIPMPPQTLTTWWDEKDELDFEPSYQRQGGIWSLPQKQGLVDSIINGFDIPKLYFADFTLLNSPLNEKKKKYSIIDGKQRLLSIIEFFEGRFALGKEFVYVEDDTLRLAGLTYDDLVRNYPKIARKFDNYPLSIMSVVTDDEAKINELFVRLNSSKPLVGAEIRNAMAGSVPQIIRKIVEHEFWSKTKFNKLRGQDKNAAAKLLLLEYTGTFVDTKKRQLDGLVERVRAAEVLDELLGDRDIENDAPEDTIDNDIVTEDDVADAAVNAEESDIERASGRVWNVLDRLAPLFTTADPLLNQQAQIPVIYWLVRGVDDGVLRHLRPFLVQFERDRAENKARPSGDAAREAVLIDYELLTRTSNDQSSIGGRYRIVKDRFERFVAAAR